MSGANIGLYTLPASRIVKSGRVIAVEPSPVNRERLEENLRLNDVRNVRVEACASGDVRGELAFSDEDSLAHVMLDGVGLKVPVKLFSDIDPGGEIVLLKVYVEGFELPVFRGAVDAIKAGRLPVIVFEMNNSLLRYSMTAEEIFGFLRSVGYQIGRWEHAGRKVVFHDREGDLVAFTPRGEQLIQQRLQT